MFITNPFLPPSSSNFFHLKTARSFLVVLAPKLSKRLTAKVLNHFWSTTWIINVSTILYISSCTFSASGHVGSRRLFSLSAYAIRATQRAPRDSQVNFTTMHSPLAMMNFINKKRHLEGNLTPTKCDQKLLVQFPWTFYFFFGEVCLHSYMGFLQLRRHDYRTIPL